ncbi:hypothetical protein Tco_0558395 [Tanacetum coccineum]
MSMWIISRGVVLLILLMLGISFKFGISGLLHQVITTIADRIRDKDTSQSKQNLQSSSMTFIHKTLIIPSVLDSCFNSSTVCEVKTLIQFMHTTMVPVHVKILKIQAGVQVSRQGELERHLQLWKRSLQKDDDDEISNLVDLHYGSTYGYAWWWMEMARSSKLALVDHHKNKGELAFHPSEVNPIVYHKRLSLSASLDREPLHCDSLRPSPEWLPCQGLQNETLVVLMKHGGARHDFYISAVYPPQNSFGFRIILDTLRGKRGASVEHLRNFFCHNYVLNGLVDSLYNVYCKTTTAKELWESLERKYKTEGAGTKKFVVAHFLDYKMVNSKNMISQLPPSWVEFKNYLKHKLKEMSVEDLVVRLCIKEDNKLAKKNTYTPDSAKANMVEHAGSSSKSKSKAKEKDKRKNNKKGKGKADYLAPKENMVNDNMDMIAMVSDVIAMISKVNLSMFHSFRSVDNGEKLYMANSATADIKGEGDVILKMTFEKELTLTNVLYVMKIRKNLVSDWLLKSLVFVFFLV